MGFEVRLVPPIYVKPFVKRHKNDAADAEAVCEAASRPGMRFVAVKSAEQQGEAMLFRTRDPDFDSLTRFQRRSGFPGRCAQGNSGSVVFHRKM